MNPRRRLAELMVARHKISRELAEHHVGEMSDEEVEWRLAKVKKQISCSWCHESSDAQAGRKLFCWSCGHRADVPRMECDCRKCRVQHIPKAPGNRERAIA